jgi:hypothetical protein
MMNVGLFHIGSTGTIHDRLAAIAIASVRRVMPRAPIVHLTNLESPALANVDEVWRRPASAPVALACLELYASLPVGNWLFLDTDTVMQHDVSHVWSAWFDIAVAKRDGTLKPSEVGTKFMARMPYNKGVVFSRSQAFWRAAVEKCQQMKPARQAWMGDQQAMNDVIAEWRFGVHGLDSRYNYPPKRADEPLFDKAIVHYKGPNRKAWMLERAA